MAFTVMNVGNNYPTAISNGGVAEYMPSSDGWQLPQVGAGLTVSIDAITAQTVTFEASYDGSAWEDITAAGYDPNTDATGATGYTAAGIVDFAGRQGGYFRIKATRSNATNALSCTVYMTTVPASGVDHAMIAEIGADLATVDTVVDSIESTVEILEDHVHKSSKVWPTLATGVTVSGGAAWTLGSKAEIWSAAQAPASAWDVHHINIESASANDTYELVLWTGDAGAEVEYARTRFTRLATQADMQCRVQGPVIAAGTRLSASVASSTGSDAVVISVQYHLY